MKKSERYQFAMLAVLNSGFADKTKLEILETLMGDKSLAEFTEKAEEEKNG